MTRQYTNTKTEEIKKNREERKEKKRRKNKEERKDQLSLRCLREWSQGEYGSNFK
jgi:hypothetical protein